MLRRRELLATLVSAVLVSAASPVLAASELVSKPKGRPRILIDRATLPTGTPDLEETLRHVKFVLRREARRADWGAGRGSTISLRFNVEKLQLNVKGNVLRVHVSARGELPRRRSAKSQLTYSGDSTQTKKLVFQVLEIAVRGVITRLSDIERTRRGA